MDIPTRSRHSLQFNGTGSEFFKIWIVNILLSILTLGIYSAWAKVRTYRYLYGNTVLDGSSFEYHAKPKQILIGRLISIALFVVYFISASVFPPLAGILLVLLILIIPWIIYRSTRFTARMSSYRNVRFGFSGKAPSFYRYLYLYPLLLVIPLSALIFALNYLSTANTDNTVLIAIIPPALILVIFLAFPWIQRNLTQYSMNHYRYGQGKFSTSPALSTAAYYFRYLGAFILSILVLIVISAAAWFLGWFDTLPNFKDLNIEQPAPELMVLFGLFSVAMYAILFVLGFLLSAYIKAGIRNHVFRRCTLDKRVQFFSSVTTAKLFYIYLGNFVLLVCTLGLAYPWNRIRLARYFAHTTQVISTGELAVYVSEQQEKQSALGEEMGEVFDIDMDLGL